MNLNESERYQPLSLHYDRIRVVNAALIELIGPCTPVTRPRSGIPVMDIPAIGYSSSDLDRPGRLPHQQGTKRGEALATETGGPGHPFGLWTPIIIWSLEGVLSSHSH